MKTVRAALCLVAVALAGAPERLALAAAKEQTVTLSGEVAGGERHVSRLRNLPAGSKLAVEIETDGSIAVLVLDEASFAEMPSPARPLFSGSGEEGIRFNLTMPHAGTYYLVLDNGRGAAARRFTFNVRATAAAGADDRIENAIDELERFESNLRRVFVFDDLEFRIDSCGQANAFAVDNVIVICLEIGPMLQERLADAGKAQDVALFMMVHEIGHALLRQWDFPAFDNEEVADEFATVLLSMYEQAERVATAGELFRTYDPIAEIERRRGRDDRHPYSAQRARNLERWIEDQDLVRRWQPFLVRHMQTDVLKALAVRPKEWTDTAAIERELARRDGE